jgi:pilus assembly protein CpaF
MKDTVNPPCADITDVLHHIDAATAAARKSAPFEQTQQFHDVLTGAHEFALNRIEEQHVDISTWSLETITKYAEIELRNYVQEWRIPINEAEMRKISAALVKELTGFGPLDDLLHDPEVEDILVNGYKDVYVSRSGVLEQATARFSDNRHLLRIIRRFLVPLGRRLDESNPMVDARLPDGGRLNAIIEPLSVSGPSVSIRKFRHDPFTPDDLLARNMFDKPVYALLRAAVMGRCNILISGGTSSGKTSLLNALAGFIPYTERVITIEDTAELSLHHPHVVRLESRVGGFEGEGAVTIRDLVRNSLRMRPDRIVIGEVRGSEVLEMLQAMNTGHDGSMSTVHANSPRDALYRLEMLCGFAGFQGNEGSLRRQIASAIDFIIQIERLGNGRRVISSVTEVIGTGDELVTTQEMYRHESVVDLDGIEHERWPGLGFQPHTPKLEPYRHFLRNASGIAP